MYDALSGPRLKNLPFFDQIQEKIKPDRYYPYVKLYYLNNHKVFLLSTQGPNFKSIEPPEDEIEMDFSCFVAPQMEIRELENIEVESEITPSPTAPETQTNTSFEDEAPANSQQNASIWMECPICKTTGFSTLHDLTIHFKSYHRGVTNPFVYPICLLSFKKNNTSNKQLVTQRPDELERELQLKNICTSRNDLKCPHCPKEFTTESDLFKHVGLHSYESPWKCHRCGTTFELLQTLRSHRNSGKCRNLLRIKSQSLANHASFQCPHCPKKLANKANLTQHINLHFPDKPYKCQKCGCRFKLSKNLQIHKFDNNCDLTNKSNISDMLICTFCDYATESLDALVEHNRIHMETNGLKTTSLEPEPMSSHAPSAGCHNQIQTQEMSFPCTKCAETFTTVSSLSLHLKICSPTTEKSSQNFPPPSKNDNEFQQSCPEVGFGDKLNPNQQIESCKVSNKYHCPNCASYFKIEYDLNIHLVTKHPDKLKVCKMNAHQSALCANTSSTKKIFSCPKCRKKFTKCTLLINHIRLCRIRMATKNRFPALDTIASKATFTGKLTTTTGTTRKPLSYNICDKQVRLDSSVNHQKLPNSSALDVPNSRCFNCSHCTQTFRCDNLRTRHEVSHGDQHFCQYCRIGTPVGFTLLRSLTKHKLEIHLISVCPICNLEFFTKSSLSIHKEKFHPNYTSVISSTSNGLPASNFVNMCSGVVLPMTTSKAAETLSEIRDPNEVVKHYLCETCGKNFESIETLRIHKNINICESYVFGQVLECTKCAQKFGCQKDIENHIKSYHPLQFVNCQTSIRETSKQSSNSLPFLSNKEKLEFSHPIEVILPDLSAHQSQLPIQLNSALLPTMPDINYLERPSNFENSDPNQPSEIDIEYKIVVGE